PAAGPRGPVRPARAARLRPAHQAQLVEQRLHFECHAAYVRPRHARPWIEIHAQLVRVLERTRAHRMRMELEAAGLHAPGDPRRVVDDDLFGGAPRWKRERDGAQPRGALLGRALLVERLA